MSGDTLTLIAMFVGTLVGIVTGRLCGLLNGVVITRLNLPPFIVTLGTMSVFRGISYVMNDGIPYNVPEYTYLGNGQLLGNPETNKNALLFVVASILALRYTPMG